MKLLLDENMPVELRREIHGHVCETVAYRRWTGKRNGELLQLAADAHFDALLTKDTNLPYQRDATNLPLAVIVLATPTNKPDDIRRLMPALLAALRELTPNAITVVE